MVYARLIELGKVSKRRSGPDHYIVGRKDRKWGGCTYAISKHGYLIARVHPQRGIDAQRRHCHCAAAASTHQQCYLSMSSAALPSPRIGDRTSFACLKGE